MANLVNPTPLNVAAAAQASGLPAPAPKTFAGGEPKTPQLAVAGHTAGPPGYATPHRPPMPTVAATTVAQTKDK